MTTDLEYLNLSKEAYKNLKEGDTVYENWKVIKIRENKLNGFYGVAFQNDKTKEVVIAFRGTELTSIHGIITDGLLTDIGQLETSPIVFQFESAKALYNDVLELDVRSDQISFTGHSLGGAVAQNMGVETGLPAVTYNSPGIGFQKIIEAVATKSIESINKVVKAINGEYKNITNYVDSDDLIGNIPFHIGTTIKVEGSFTDPYIRPIRILDYINPFGGFDALSYINNSLEAGFNYLKKLIPELIIGSHGLENFMDDFNEAGQITVPRRDPLILDLDGDGIETTSLENSLTFFDLDSDGFAERIGWVGKDDGILVRDINGDGIINNGTELFGDRTVLKNGEIATGGFQALADLDSNQDGMFDESDSGFNEVKVWKDIDSNGIASSDELFSFQQLRIKSIQLNNTSTNIVDGQGNIQTRVGTYEMEDGTKKQLGEYLFDQNKYQTIATEWFDVPEDISVLPNLQGSGQVYSLHQAIIRDSSGSLKQLVLQFMAEGNIQERNRIFEEILFKWTGTEDINPNSRGSNIDARKLGVLEKLLGTKFVGTNGPNPIAEAATVLNQSYNRLFEKMYSKMLLQTHLKDLNELIHYKFDIETNKIIVDLSEVKEELLERISENEANGLSALSEFTRVIKGYQIEELVDFDKFRYSFVALDERFAWTIDSVGKNFIEGDVNVYSITGTNNADAIKGTDGNDDIYGNNGNDVIHGQRGEDRLYGGNGEDIIFGGYGNDYIYGGYGNDELNGGAGNDYLEGSYGNDVYLFGLGSGVDTIYDNDSTVGNMDIIRMGKGVVPTDIVVKRKGDHLELSIKGTPDKLIVKNYFYRDYYQVEKIEFADGTVWDVAFIKAVVSKPTEENDEIRGYDETNDELYGLGGNDVLYGGNGDDVAWEELITYRNAVIINQ